MFKSALTAASRAASTFAACTARQAAFHTQAFVQRGISGARRVPQLPQVQQQLRHFHGELPLERGSNCGITYMRRKEPRMQLVFELLDNIAKRGSRDFEGADGNALIFRGKFVCNYLSTKFPDLKEPLQKGEFSVFQAFFKNKGKEYDQVKQMFEDFGIPVQGEYIVPQDTSVLVDGERIYPHDYSRLIITKPQSLEHTSITEENLRLLKKLGIKTEGPLSKFDFYKVNRLIFERVSLNPEMQKAVEAISNEASLSYPSLIREEVVQGFFEEFSDADFVKMLEAKQDGFLTVSMQTRAANRMTEPTMFGVHGLAQENGDNLNIFNTVYEQSTNPFIRMALGFKPDFSPYPDTINTDRYFNWQLLMGRSSTEAYAMTRNIMSAETFGPSYFTQLVTLAFRNMHGGPHESNTAYTNEDGEPKQILHKDKHAARPAQAALFNDEEGPEQLSIGDFVMGTTLPASVAKLKPRSFVNLPKGVPIVTGEEGDIIELDISDLEPAAKAILDGLHVHENDCEIRSEYALPGVPINRVVHANLLETDFKESFDTLIETGEPITVAMGQPRVSEVNGPIKMSNVRGSVPVKDAIFAGDPLAFRQIMNGPPLGMGSILDKSCHDFSGASILPHPLLTNLKAFEGAPVVKAVRPKVMSGASYKDSVDATAREIVDLVLAGHRRITVQDYDETNFDLIPQSTSQVAQRTAKLLKDARVIEGSSLANIGVTLALDSIYVLDITRHASVFSSLFNAVFARSIFSGQLLNKEQAANWHRGSSAILEEYFHANGLEFFNQMQGNQMTIMPNECRPELIDFFGFDPRFADANGSDFGKLENHVFSRFAADTPVWRNLMGDSRGSALFHGRDPKTSVTANLMIKGKDDPKKAEEALAIMKNASNFSYMDNGQVKPLNPAKRFLIAGAGIAGLASLDKILENDPNAEIDILNHGVPLGSGMTALFPSHRSRNKGPALKTQGTLEHTAPGQIRYYELETPLSDGDIGVLKGHYDLVVDATGAPSPRALTGFPGAELATDPKTVYEGYSAGAVFDNFVPNKSVAVHPFNGAFGGGDSVVDIVKSWAESASNLDDTGFIRPRGSRAKYASVMAYRGSFLKTACKKTDLKAFEAGGGRIMAAFQVPDDLDVSKLSDKERENYEFWTERRVADNFANIPWDNDDLGRRILFIDHVSINELMQQPGSSLLALKFTQAGIQSEMPVGTFVPAIGYDDSGLSAPPDGVVAVGQRTGSYGDIPHTVKLTHKIMDEALAEPVTKQAGPRLSDEMMKRMLPRGNFREIESIRRFLNYVSTGKFWPFKTREDVERAFLFEGVQKSKDDGGALVNALSQWHGQKGISESTECVVVTEPKNERVLRIFPTDFNEGESLLHVVIRKYKENGWGDVPLDMACDCGTTCGTCYGIQLPGKVVHELDSINASDHPNISTVLCGVTSQQALGSIFSIGDVSPVLDLDSLGQAPAG